MRINKLDKKVILKDGTTFVVSGMYYHTPASALDALAKAVMEASGCSAKEAAKEINSKTLTDFIDDCLANPANDCNYIYECGTGVEEQTSGCGNSIFIDMYDISAADKSDMDDYLNSGSDEFYISDPRTGKIYALSLDVD